MLLIIFIFYCFLYGYHEIEDYSANKNKNCDDIYVEQKET